MTDLRKFWVRDGMAVDKKMKPSHVGRWQVVIGDPTKRPTAVSGWPTKHLAVEAAERLNKAAQAPEPYDLFEATEDGRLMIFTNEDGVYQHGRSDRERHGGVDQRPQLRLRGVPGETIS